MDMFEEPSDSMSCIRSFPFIIVENSVPMPTTIEMKIEKEDTGILGPGIFD